jgi:hypothetical protein
MLSFIRSDPRGQNEHGVDHGTGEKRNSEIGTGVEIVGGTETDKCQAVIEGEAEHVGRSKEENRSGTKSAVGEDPVTEKIDSQIVWQRCLWSMGVIGAFRDLSSTTLHRKRCRFAI